MGIKDSSDHASKRRIVILVVSGILLLLLVLGAVIGIVISRRNNASDPHITNGNTVSSAMKGICSVTTFPLQCLSSLSSVNGSEEVTDPEQLFRLSLFIAMDGLILLRPIPGKLSASLKDPKATTALSVCTEMIDDSIDLVNESLAILTPVPGEQLLTGQKMDDLRTYLSAVLTNQETCLDGLSNVTGLREKLAGSMKNSTEFTSNCLAIATKILNVLDNMGVPFHRKLLSDSGMPAWVESDPGGRRLLQDQVFTPDVTVALDGTGQYASINAALAAVPAQNMKPFVIYVKAGTYTERVLVAKTMWNVVMIGDGAGKTIITGNRSFVGVNGRPPYPLRETASVAVEGRGFMARGITFENSAGPPGEQAVALMVRSDHVIIYQSLIIGFQDSLYAHSFRQFYRECTIVGTVDFIFGDGAVVIQNSAILPRQPGPGQKNFLTAQGRSDPNSVGGTSIHSCKIAPYDNVTAPTYLGRPWKPYSRTVYMTSDIGAMIDPAGWSSWDSTGNAPSTIFYGEYMNIGAGANTAGRVKWVGYKPALSNMEAQSFSVGSFIQGGTWISYGVPFAAGV